MIKLNSVSPIFLPVAVHCSTVAVLDDTISSDYFDSHFIYWTAFFGQLIIRAFAIMYTIETHDPISACVEKLTTPSSPY